MKYLFFSESLHLYNLFHMPRNLIESLLLVGIGILLRMIIKSKKEFYQLAIGCTVAWVILDILVAVLTVVDNRLFSLYSICFTFAWAFFCGIIGAWSTHLICALTHKRKFQ